MRELVITSAGEALAARLFGGITTARFTRICASCGDYSAYGRNSLRQLSELDGVCQSTAVSGTHRVDENTVEIYAAMDNKELKEGYYTRAVGLYAEDGDKNEILFAVCTEDVSPFYMPPFMNGAVTGVSYKLKVRVGASENVIIDVSAEVYATAVQLEDEVKRINERIDALSFDDDIVSHNESADSHPKLLALLNGLTGRVDLLERAASGEITSNPFSMTFGDSEGIVLSEGIWNPAEARIEF